MTIERAAALRHAAAPPNTASDSGRAKAKLPEPPKPSGPANDGWKAIEDRINDRGNGMKTFIGIVRPGESKIDQLVPDRPGGDARPGHSWDVDPGSGDIARKPDIETMEWGPDDQARADRGWDWGVDPDTGEIVKQPNGPQTMEWGPDDQARADRGWIWDVDPDTGEITKVPLGPRPL